MGLTLALLGGGAVSAANDPLVSLLPDDPQPYDYLGLSVDLEGAVAIVAATGVDGSSGTSAGVAYLFDVSTGAELQRLLPPYQDPNASFGTSVAIASGRAVVGASGYAFNGGSNSGRADAFDASTGQHLFELQRPGGAINDFFGVAVAADGGRIVVGCPGDDDGGPGVGAAYLYDAATGALLFQLLPDDAFADAAFGDAVAIDGPTVIVGARNHGANGSYAGAAYVFDGLTGAQVAMLLPTNGSSADHFGYSVAVDGALVAVGAPGAETGGVVSGRAYLFDARSGAQLAKLVPEDGAQADWIGNAVAVHGRTVLVGASMDNDNGPDRGSVHVFDAETAERIARLSLAGGAPFDAFGHALALRGTTAVVSALYDDSQGTDAGGAYVFDLTAGTAVPFCFGAGAGAACPCGNAGAPGHGCANGGFDAGARLVGAGSPCVGNDDLVLRASSSARGQPGLFFQGVDAVAGGAGLPFGDGLRCAAGDVQRLELVAADADGVASSSVPIAATSGLVAGDVRRYQWWYRDPAGSPCGTDFNLSNGLEVTWAP